MRISLGLVLAFGIGRALAFRGTKQESALTLKEAFDQINRQRRRAQHWPQITSDPNEEELLLHEAAPHNVPPQPAVAREIKQPSWNFLICAICLILCLTVAIFSFLIILARSIKRRFSYNSLDLKMVDENAPLVLHSTVQQ